MYGNEICAGRMADFLAPSTMARLQSRNGQYCTTYEAMASVNFDSPPQHEPRLVHTSPSPHTMLRRTVGAPPKYRQRLCRLVLKAAADFFANCAFCDGFSVCLELAGGGMMVALLYG